MGCCQLSPSGPFIPYLVWVGCQWVAFIDGGKRGPHYNGQTEGATPLHRGGASLGRNTRTVIQLWYLIATLFGDIRILGRLSGFTVWLILWCHWFRIMQVELSTCGSVRLFSSMNFACACFIFYWRNERKMLQATLRNLECRGDNALAILRSNDGLQFDTTLENNHVQIILNQCYPLLKGFTADAGIWYRSGLFEWSNDQYF